MDINTLIVVAAVGIGFLGVIAYLLFMVFLPEWVGITGKVAIEAERSHGSGDEAKESRFWSKMGQEPIKAREEVSAFSPEHENPKGSKPHSS